MAMATSGKSVRDSTLRFGEFVNLNVKMFSAAREEKSGFNQVHQHADGTVCKTSQQNYCSGCNSVVPYANLSKGTETSSGGYAVVTDEELKRVAAPETTDIVITQFVDLGEVDPVFFDSSFFLAPDTKKTTAHITAYELLYQLMKTRGKAGVATLTMRGKLHNVFIRVFENGLMLHTIFNSNEIRNYVQYNAPREVVVSPKQLEVAGMLMDTLIGDFDAKGVENKYARAVEDLIESKRTQGNNGPASADDTRSAPVSNEDGLMAAMMASLAQNKAKKAAASEAKVTPIDSKVA